MPTVPGRPSLDSPELDAVQPIDSEAIMVEVRAEVARRRASGEYPPMLDDLPAFADLGLDDDLVASLNRLDAMSRIPGITPVIEEISSEPIGIEHPSGFEPVRSPKRRLTDQFLIRGRALARRVVGHRLESVVRHGADYLLASARHARLSTGRILDLERRVSELERRRDPGSDPGDSS